MRGYWYTKYRGIYKVFNALSNSGTFKALSLILTE